MNRFRIALDKNFDPELLRRVEEVLHGDNLLQAILHAHLLLERAITSLICEKLKRPGILEDGTYGRWSFQQKLGLYIALYDPPEDRQRMLLGFNRLRNALAHRLENEEECVARYLPWDGESARPDAWGHLWAVTAILFFELGIVHGIERLDREPPGA